MQAHNFKDEEFALNARKFVRMIYSIQPYLVAAAAKTVHGLLLYTSHPSNNNRKDKQRIRVVHFQWIYALFKICSWFSRCMCARVRARLRVCVSERMLLKYNILIYVSTLRGYATQKNMMLAHKLCEFCK